MAKRLLTGFVLSLLIAAPVLAQEAESVFKDKIRYIDDDGEVRDLENVRVMSATYRQVVYQTRGGRQAPPKDGSKVLRISYGDEPGVYTKAVKELNEGRFQAAAEDFDGAKNAVEAGAAREVLANPQHAYTKLLRDSVLSPDDAGTGRLMAAARLPMDAGAG